MSNVRVTAGRQVVAVLAILVCSLGMPEPSAGQFRPPDRFQTAGQHPADAPTPFADREPVGYTDTDAFVLRVLGGVAGIVVGNVAAAGIVSGCDGGAGCPAGRWVAALSLITVTTGAGVALAAAAADRKPAWYHTMAGAAVLAAPGIVIMADAAKEHDSMGRLVAVMIFVPGALGGSLLGNYLGQ
jgi:hypothetical protein